jgi:tetratricopeptide (TPR) repeat protein
MMMFQGPVRAASDLAAANIQAAAALLEIAKTAFDAGDHEAALRDIDLALTFVPQSPHGHWNRGQVLLCLGRYQEGLREFEWRSQLFGNPAREVKAPRWEGQPIDGKRLALIAEHGFGDCIMMLRYVPVLQAMGARVMVCVPPPLVLLMQRLGVPVLDNWPADSEMDFYCPLFSVMTVLDHGVADIPPAVYLPCRLHEARTGVGLAWSGNPEHANDKQRSIKRSVMADALELKKFTSCQDASFDFAHTAQLMARLQHIVTVDTSAAHLAGSLGHPSVHLLLPFAPDWRWYNAAAWYPAINLYRQTVAGDWSGPLDRVRQAIA